MLEEARCGVPFAGQWNSSPRGGESKVWYCSFFLGRVIVYSVITFLVYCKTMELTA